MSEPRNVNDYLDALSRILPLPPDRARRVLVEVEQHLETATEALVAGGATADDAERGAIARFGSPDVVARGFAASPVPWVPLVRAGARSLFAIFVVGLLAIGTSGLLALALSLPLGKSFIAGDASGVTYTASRCAQLMEYDPGAANCTQAAVDHHFGEIVDYRLAAGLLGLLALGTGLLLRRRAPAAILPEAFGPTVGASLFGAAAVAQFALTGGSSGQVGALLSGAVVSALVAAWYGIRLSGLLAAWVSADD